MRVGFDVGPLTARPAGVGHYIVAMAQALASATPPDALVLFGRRPGTSGLPDSVPTVDRRLGSYRAWLELQAARDAKRAGLDLVHYSNGGVPTVRHGYTVLAVHDMSMVRYPRMHPATRRIHIPFVASGPHLADLVVVPSHATADELIRIIRLPACKIEVVPYAPRPAFAPADDATTREVTERHGLRRGGYILALGTIEPRKNHARLVDAFEGLAQAGGLADGMSLAIAGSLGWGCQAVVDRISASPVRERIPILGYVPDEDLPALLTRSAAVAYVSLYEGFGLPVVEAMACGAPTVTSNLSSMPEVAGEAAFLVNPFDIRDIRRGLTNALAASDSSRASVSARSVEQAARFSWSRCAASVVDLYRSRLAS